MLRFLKKTMVALYAYEAMPGTWFCRFDVGGVPCPAQAGTESLAMREFAQYLRDIADEVEAEAEKIIP